MANVTIEISDADLQKWFCPLLNREIEDGDCADINYQRIGYFKPDVLTDVLQETGKTVEAVAAVCDACHNQQKVLSDG